ncbi:MAG: sigma-54 dependent transcriptional regulator [Candidatus Latescibacterota bacterium]
MNILLVDDEPLSLDSLNDFLGTILGHTVTQCDNGAEALRIFMDTPFPMIITDLRMPGMSGIELLQQVKVAAPHGCTPDVVIMTGYGDMNSAIEALRAGAYDFLQKPIVVEELAAVVNRIAEHQTLLCENREFARHFDEKLEEAVHETKVKYDLLKSAYAEFAGVGEIGIYSKAMREVVSVVERLHNDRSMPALIEGETGTGKEVIARLIHYGAGDVTTPFVPINCSAIAPNLFESELFGYEGSSFTSSKKEGMKGKFEIAQKGTLFLDEIGDLPLDLQPKLLRAIQEREIYRVGGIKVIKLDVRIICATNRNLVRLVKDGVFRNDLFYRLNVGRIYIPPLREQKEAIAPLAQMFLERYAKEKKRRFRFLSEKAAKILENYDWSGNVRELQNTIERVVLLYDDTSVKPEHVHFISSDETESQNTKGVPFDPENLILPPDSLNLRYLEDIIINKTLSKFNGNKTKTATYLGMTRTTLRSKLKKN